MSRIKMEISKYVEYFCLAKKDVNILHWWRDHKKELPNLAKEKFQDHPLKVSDFSPRGEGGDFVTKKWSRFAPKKVEVLKVIKENKSLIEQFKSIGTYEVKSINTNPFNEITVDKVLRNMLLEEKSDELEENFDNDRYHENKYGNDDDEENKEAEILSDIDDIEDGVWDSYS